MYGMLLESVRICVQMEYGEQVWSAIARDAGTKCNEFCVHQQYPDVIILRLASALARWLSTSSGESQPDSPGHVKHEHQNDFTKAKNSNTASQSIETQDSVMLFFGRCFVKYTAKFGYDSTFRATGRYFCTFLQSMDNLHQRMQFSFPRMRSPSMTLARAHARGAELVYRSTRSGFSHYLIGQLYEIAESIFSMKLKASIVREETDGGRCVVVLRLEFDNGDYVQSLISRREIHRPLPSVPASFLLQLFPFGVLLDRRMRITSAGDKLAKIWGGPPNILLGTSASDVFRLRKPKVSFSWDKILQMQWVLFELEVIRWGQGAFSGKGSRVRRGSQDVRRGSNEDRSRRGSQDLYKSQLGQLKNQSNYKSVQDLLQKSKELIHQPDPPRASKEPVKSGQDMAVGLISATRQGGEESRRSVGSQNARAVLLKGQMRHLDESDEIFFLCSPIFNSLDELTQADLFLSDLNGHGLSRELLLTGWQHCSRLELLCEQAQRRSGELERSVKLLDRYKRRSDDLLYSMIPKPLAVQLRAGKNSKTSCKDIPCLEAFDSVSVIFCELEGVADSRASVMDMVNKINGIFSRLDRILESHRVYKVETVGTEYMCVAGAPFRAPRHAEQAASAALAVSRAARDERSVEGRVRARIGLHSGPCVACVLGHRLPRYCLVGDTINTASRMQSSCEPGRVQMSAATVALLPEGRFRMRRRGFINVKGKGMMETYWLEGETEKNENDSALEMLSLLGGSKGLEEDEK